MRTVDRQGVHIEQCERCRGVFLDAGELEQIALAEERHYASPPPYTPPAGAAQAPPPPDRYAYRDSPPAYGQRGYGDSPPPYYRKRKRSFLEGLFD